MKHIFFVVITVVILCTGLSGCKAKEKPETNPLEGSFGKDGSYAMGMNFGRNLKSLGIYPDWDEVLQGMKDYLYDNKTRFNEEDIGQILNETYNAFMDKQAEIDFAENKQAGIDFLEKNKQRPGITTTESGLQYEVIIPGDGPKPTDQDIVRVHYRGTLIDGTEFDSSYSSGKPVVFPLDEVIKGWTEGLQLMNTGSKYRLFIPSDLGYGSRGSRPQIPPLSTLVFEVELLDIIRN
ncbi:MAG: FKBP-type peptidyl-prolyl cis-trans isomerase [Treponema sp.]|jgi:FKBP-type peptidyl-prolyl cis-trans isomerase|nr:FKBP-type peptidyl-prolyl cis-trans isomerase [Treponema sp.]